MKRHTSSSQLAVNGGPPVRSRPFPAWPTSGHQEEEALLRVLRSGKWWQYAYGQGVELIEDTTGENRAEVSRFQDDFAAYHDCRYGIAAANGTATLELILRSLDIGPGDEVIVPAYTFIASATSVLQIGAVPIFVDIDPTTYNLDPACLEAAIGPRTRAIMVVHFGGQAVDMDAIGQIAARHHLAIVEDAAHAHGAEWMRRKCGSLGIAGSFSFQASKNMTAGEGGAITTNDAHLAELATSYLWAGRKAGRPWYEHYRLGWNYRLTEFQGALLRVQLERLDADTARRDTNGRYLTEALRQNVNGLTPMRLDDRATRVSFHICMCRYDADAFHGMSRNAFIEALAAEGIPCLAGYSHPLYRNPMFLEKDFWKGGFPCVGTYADESLDYAAFAARCPVSEAVCAESVWFAQNLFLGEAGDMDDIVEAVLKIQQATDQ